VLALEGRADERGPGDDRATQTFSPERRSSLATPNVDMIRPMRYQEMYPPDEGSRHPIAVTRTMFVDAIDRRAAETIVEHLEAPTAPMRAVQIRVLGEAMGRVPVEATAFAHRKSRVMVNVAAVYERLDDAPVHHAWAVSFASGFAAAERRRVRELLGDEGPAGVRAAYPGSTWERLVAIKRRYDPTNLFRLNQNIPPASGRGVDLLRRLAPKFIWSSERARQDAIHGSCTMPVSYDARVTVRAQYRPRSEYAG
jgi:hypothetical protein